MTRGGGGVELVAPPHKILRVDIRVAGVGDEDPNGGFGSTRKRIGSVCGGGASEMLNIPKL